MNPQHISHNNQISIEEIIRLALKNNRDAQKILFHRYSGTMMTVCRRYARDQQEAEDFLQESFIRVFRYLDQYKNKGSFEGWVRKTVVNTILRAIQTRTKHLYKELTPYANEIAVESDVLDHLENEEIIALINQLPEGYRIIFNLYVLEGFSHAEIGQKLNISESTSRSQLVRAKNSLRKSLSRLNNLATYYYGSY